MTDLLCLQITDAHRQNFLFHRKFSTGALFGRKPGNDVIRNMNRIKDILKVQGRTQIWLGKKINKSYVVVTNYCNNKTQPSLSTLTKIAALLEVDVRDLLSPGDVEINLHEDSLSSSSEN